MELKLRSEVHLVRKFWHVLGIVAMAAQLTFDYGAGGGSGVAYLQTSLDQANEGGLAGGTWVDIAAMSFATTPKVVVLNFSALTPHTTALTPGDGTMTSDTAIDGVLGDRFRLKIVSASTAYTGATSVGGSLVVR